MKTECTRKKDKFQALGKKEIVAEFNGGILTSDGGCLMLREIEKRRGILKYFDESFTDYRDEKRIEYSVLSLVFSKSNGPGIGR